MQSNNALPRDPKLHYNFFPQKAYILVGDDVLENYFLQLKDWDYTDS